MIATTAMEEWRNLVQICPQEGVHFVYKSQNEEDVSKVVLEQKRQNMTTRKIAEIYGAPITCADISRIYHGKFPKGKEKRIALGLPPTSNIAIIGGGDVPNGSQAIRALRCECGQYFIQNHPRRSHCFICRPARIKPKRGDQ
jgi:hypothetical protein